MRPLNGKGKAAGLIAIAFIVSLRSVGLPWWAVLAPGVFVFLVVGGLMVSGSAVIGTVRKQTRNRLPW